MNQEDKNIIYDFYCKDEMKNLKKICNPLIIEKGVPYMDWDDLYSDAMKVLMESVESYDPKRNCSFSTYLTGNIKRSFYDWSRDKMREKRCNLRRDKNGNLVKDENGNKIPINNASLNFESEDNSVFGESLPDKDRLDLADLFGTEGMSWQINLYLARLTLLQKKIVGLLVNGYKPREIQIILEISPDDYNNHLGYIKSYEVTRILM